MANIFWLMGQFYFEVVSRSNVLRRILVIWVLWEGELWLLGDAAYGHTSPAGGVCAKCVLSLD